MKKILDNFKVINEVKLPKEAFFYLSRSSDGEGESGDKIFAARLHKDDVEKMENMIRVGSVVHVSSSMTARWWCTTPVTKIISAEKDKVVFKTQNSVYTLIIQGKLKG